MSEMSEAERQALSDAVHWPEEEGSASFDCACSQVYEAVEAILAARVADAAAAARAEVVEAVEALGMEWMQTGTDPRWDSAMRSVWVSCAGQLGELLDLLAPPVDHAHAADGTEVGA